MLDYTSIMYSECWIRQLLCNRNAWLHACYVFRMLDNAPAMYSKGLIMYTWFLCCSIRKNFLLYFFFISRAGSAPQCWSRVNWATPASFTEPLWVCTPFLVTREFVSWHENDFFLPSFYVAKQEHQTCTFLRFMSTFLVRVTQSYTALSFSLFLNHINVLKLFAYLPSTCVHCTVGWVNLYQNF